MKRMTDNDLCNTKGGFELNSWMLLGISGIVVFISGVIEGITNPERCINQ